MYEVAICDDTEQERIQAAEYAAVRAREILYREETTETLMEYLKMMLR